MGDGISSSVSGSHAANKKSRSASFKRLSPSSTLLGSSRREQVVIESQGKPDMAACFLQYCAMCEKQITTPCNSILYCSEACYRKDSVKPLTAANVSPRMTPPTSTPSSPRAILFPRTPTGFGNPDASVTRIPADQHEFKSDLDPTEWKPKLPHRNKSDAFHYLSQFHRSMTQNNDTPDEMTFEVPLYSASSTIATPSLSHTPTTSASSFSTSTGYNGYDFTTRPLPPRHNRWYSTSACGANGMDLVTPHIPPSTETMGFSSTPTDHQVWKKKSISAGGRRQDGLGALFNSK